VYDFIKANPKQAGELIASDVKLTPEQFSKVLPKFDYVISSVRARRGVEEDGGVPAQSELSKNPVDIDAFVDTRY